MTRMLGVESEVRRLRQPIVHRPGSELTRLTPSNWDELLWVDVLWVDKAREEHDIFAQVLRDRDVAGCHFTDLLAQTLELPAAKAFVLERVCTVRRALNAMNAPGPS